MEDHEAKTHPAQPTPIEPEGPVLGSAEGQITFQPGWDAPLSDAEIEDIFG